MVTAAVVRVSLERDFEKYPQFAQGIAEILVEQLPTQPGKELDTALLRSSERLGVELVLWARDGSVLARSAHVPSEITHRTPGAHYDGPHGVVIPLSDGRQVGAFFRHAPNHAKFFLWLTFFAAVLALGCYPVARGITRRLEQLRSVADSWGQGSLSARAPVEGHDEIAELSRTFNQAAERIQSLVAQQKRMLASASHELRSPLARMQMALALLDDAAPRRRAELVVELEREVGELNQLIEDFLVAAKAEQSSHKSPVNLSQVVLQECERLNIVDVQVASEVVSGNEAALRSLVRNLLENAQRHGGGTEIAVSLSMHHDQCLVSVEDRGPGIDAAEAERIFRALLSTPRSQ